MATEPAAGPSFLYTWNTSDFSMEVGETVTITLNYINKGNSNIVILEDGVQIGTTTTNTYEYTPTSAGIHTLHYFNTIDSSPLTVTVTGGGVSGNDTTTLNGALTELGETIADNLTSMGVTASANDGLTTLANKVLQISGSGGGSGSGSGQEIVSFDNITTEFNYTRKRGNDGFSVTIPSGVTSLGVSCFNGCTGLTNVIIPSGVTNLGNNCFNNCPSLTSVTIPSSVTSIGDSCFYDCTGLTNITIPSSITSIGTKCFSGCRGLINITIPSSITTLETRCFYNCSGLTNITIPSSVTSIGDNCFQNCRSLTNITIPSSVTSIGSSCFTSCTGLTNITIPSSVTSIGTYCFQNCRGLISVTIPSSVTSIGAYCFGGCTNLVDYQLYWETPPVTWSSSLMPNNADTYFTIPQGTTANYTAKNFPSDKLIERSE